MSVLNNGQLRVLNRMDDGLVNQVFGQHADRIRSQMNAKLRGAPSFEISPGTLIKTINEYEDRLEVPRSALSSLKF